ncbi:hypothetical protein Pelo_19827 [Pelomyxa schiedti]|nr:hypothetical protein Pelo_19827 [Pelomyxa schiedti]
MCFAPRKGMSSDTISLTVEGRNIFSSWLIFHFVDMHVIEAATTGVSVLVIYRTSQLVHAATCRLEPGILRTLLHDLRTSPSGYSSQRATSPSRLVQSS